MGCGGSRGGSNCATAILVLLGSRGILQLPTGSSRIAAIEFLQDCRCLCRPSDGWNELCSAIRAGLKSYKPEVRSNSRSDLIATTQRVTEVSPSKLAEGGECTCVHCPNPLWHMALLQQFKSGISDLALAQECFGIALLQLFMHT